MAQMVFHAFYMLISGEGSGVSGGHALQAGPRRFFQAIWYNLGTATVYPRFGKYGYKEKFSIKGDGQIFLISITGVSFGPNLSMKFLPKFFLTWRSSSTGTRGCSLVILLFWHVYNEHLHPSVFPMNNAWLTGKVEAEGFARTSAGI